MSPADVPAALETLWRTVGPRMPDLAASVRRRGPRWAAAELLAAMDRQTSSRTSAEPGAVLPAGGRESGRRD
ncbi:hypothetical protein [Streptomyces sp. DSM 15324]|uniref:hypothetical protein n=1 Tax=Streptomyces sp. DSM 15324 TaxID=1739111 RepID=UPI0007466A11|nr:hypothetical protein [Streptomyces sp. DSM 15324]KUO09875.1 hypothetical protein AQJ58_22800 [Streptomyces sp. DSM 15324]